MDEETEMTSWSYPAHLLANILTLKGFKTNARKLISTDIVRQYFAISCPLLSLPSPRIVYSPGSLQSQRDEADTAKLQLGPVKLSLDDLTLNWPTDPN